MSQTEIRTRPAGRRRHRLFNTEAHTALVFLLPSFLGLLIFLILPIAASLALSFSNWSLLSEPRFVGLSNYIRLLTVDPAFFNVLGNTLFFTVEYVILNLVVALGLATWIASLKRAQRWFRVVFFLPTFTPSIAVSMVWLLMFTPGGLVDAVFRTLGVHFPNLLINPHLAMQVIVIVTLWGNVGYNLILFNAALDLVPQSYLDAAEIDGAGPWQRFWKIRLPLISPTLFFGVVMTAITSLQVFDQIFVLTRGGPGSATATLGFAIYQYGFTNYQMGYASALAWVMFIIIMALTALQFWLQRKWVHYDS
ncbi:carbohydrate ABC transporter permease [Martelella endophytica]|uniref:ABC transporter substrate-binding protein n=1 Tax=Martelella endophytica TaxID=1486262 RepID=A0A0D5LVV2_MAREN|nr:sugar ABC transporter permease [Martelella endophytica]AJY48095.1 ABC transporter substrate-binding protein [Martelella endophytica]